MDHKTQIALTKRVFAHLDNKSTDTASAIMRNAATAYTSPDRLALETEKLFRQEPLLITMSCHMPAPGDYVTDDNTDVPILVVRGDDGQVRAFLNVCQHRASRLVNGSGHLRKHLICPYHAWSFDKAGKFSHAPSQKDFDGFDFDNCSLTELPAAEQGGLIWVRPQGTTPIDVTEHLAGLAPELDNFSFENYHLMKAGKYSVR